MKTHVGLRLDSDLLAILQTLADDDHRTFSDYCRLVLTAHVESKGYRKNDQATKLRKLAKDSDKG